MSDRAERRALDFRDFDAVVRDAEALAAGGYTKAGNWDLSQVCGHLADWMSYPIDGVPKASPPARVVLWVVRNTVGRGMLKRVLRERRMPAGTSTLSQSVHAAGGSDADGVERLRRAVQRFRGHEGPFLPSPLFGQMSREEITQLQLVHCAHHLGFLTPRA